MRDREVGNLTGRMTAGRWLKEVEEDGDAAEAETDNGLSGGKAKAIANYPPHTIRDCFFLFLFFFLYCVTCVSGGRRGSRSSDGGVCSRIVSLEIVFAWYICMHVLPYFPP